MPITHHDEASTSSTSTPKCSIKVQLVSKSKSERLMEKYFDAFEFDFDYEQSGIWSPPIKRTAYIGSPGRVFTEEELMAKLKNAFESRSDSCTRRGTSWSCISSLFSSFQKRVKKRKEIKFGM